MVDKRRYITVKKRMPVNGPVVYWMSRDQRLEDNWALLFARQLAREQGVPLAVVFTLVRDFPGATSRQYEFMLGGLEELESSLINKGIPFRLLPGDPPTELGKFLEAYKVGAVVSDFDPLRVKRLWKKSLLDRNEVSFFTVDAHNIVPAFYVSDKQEYGAHTLRPKIKRLLESFLVPFPGMEPMAPHRTFEYVPVDWEAVRRDLDPDTGVGAVNWLVPGEKAARLMLDEFIRNRLDFYAVKRNDPNSGIVSNLSPYLHFGQISAQRVALEVLKERNGDENTASFLDEVIIRRELSDNYCLYNPDYDKLDRIPSWAGKTLAEHRMDEREYIYKRDSLEAGNTHEPLWNAAQMEMVKSGKMHGYLRMYWAKKILEWTASPEEALETAIYLNDRYQLDGRDPNGYAGCAWSVAGVHDRAWAERPVYGKIRYMNERGCRRKFDVDGYIRKWHPA